MASRLFQILAEILECPLHSWSLLRFNPTISYPMVLMINNSTKWLWSNNFTIHLVPINHIHQMALIIRFVGVLTNILICATYISNVARADKISFWHSEKCYFEKWRFAQKCYTLGHLHVFKGPNGPADCEKPNGCSTHHAATSGRMYWRLCTRAIGFRYC